MRSLKVTLAYDGTDYCGWQFQPTRDSVQGRVERAWLKVTGEKTRVMASGRTDAGVHAVGQVISLRTQSELSNETLVRALNSSLPPDIRIHQVVDAEASFHAIRDAQGKRYRYMMQAGGVPDVFIRRYVWHLPHSPDLDAMKRAAKHLVGRHDFCSFQTTGSSRKTSVRHVSELTLTRRETGTASLICIEIEANGFLYNMVRIIVGTLVEVGRGKQPPDWPREVIASGRRDRAGPTAPAHGLCLVSVRY